MFAKIASSHLKMFLFAGHETTASTLSFVYNTLYSRPEKLARIRAEHDAVLGTDLAQTAKRLADDPQLLNQLPYTSACIKETLRLWPPAGTARDGQPNLFLRHPETGKRFPTEGWFLFGCSFAYQRSPKFWPRVSEFLPERWLAEEGDELYVSSKRGAYRPFELGPRNCIGQELVQAEIRAILAMTLRDFDIEPQWAEDGPVVLGEKGYQVFPNNITGSMKDQFPVKIRLRQPTV
jgi:cytochrome P450